MRCRFMCSFCTRLIDSSPPATTIGTRSTITRCAASAMACMPEEQKRLTVMPAIALAAQRVIVDRRALRQRAAHDDVLDLAGLEARALDGVRDDVAADGGAVRVVEGSAIRPADRRAGGGDDDGVCHGPLLVRVGRWRHYTGRHGREILCGARRGRRAGRCALRARRALLRGRLPCLADD